MTFPSNWGGKVTGGGVTCFFMMKLVDKVNGLTQLLEQKILKIFGDNIPARYNKL